MKRRASTIDEVGGLPPEAAFVLQLEPASGSMGRAMAGRVEHVVSGRATRFGSSAELLAFIRRTLGGLASTPDGGLLAGGAATTKGKEES